MRLLFLNHNYRYAGTYYRVMPMAEQLAQRGHDVTVFTVSPDHRWKATWSMVNGVHLCETPNVGQNNSGNGYGPLDNLLRIADALARRYDIVHMFDHKPNATLAGFAGRLRGARLVADWADWWGGPGGINDVPQRRIPTVGKFEEWWEVKSKLWADGIVTISTILQQRAWEAGCPAEQVLYLPTGAAIDRIRPVALAEARQVLGIPLERPIVACIGRADLGIVVNALQHLPNVWLMVIGQSDARVAEMAQTAGTADRLWLTGIVPDSQVSTYLACANVMCLPMTHRAADLGRLPNKILDYMCAGRPTVASPIGDIRMIVEKYHIGLLAEPDAFAEAIRRLLGDPQLCKTMGQQARQTAETVFNWQGLIDQLEGFYFRLLKKRHSELSSG